MAGNSSYTNSIDIWSLGVIVHEMLTLEIPFLDTFTNEDSALMSCISTIEDTVDTALLYRYCQGATRFPCDSLRNHDVSEDGIEFLKSLMAVNPKERISAAAALANEWLVQDDPTAGPSSPHPVRPIPPAVAGSPGFRQPSATEKTESAPTQGMKQHETIDKVDAVRLLASSDIFVAVGKRNEKLKTSATANLPALAPAIGLPWDQTYDNTKERGISSNVKKDKSDSQSGSPDAIARFLKTPLAPRNNQGLPNQESDRIEQQISPQPNKIRQNSMEGVIDIGLDLAVIAAPGLYDIYRSYPPLVEPAKCREQTNRQRNHSELPMRQSGSKPTPGTSNTPYEYGHIRSRSDGSPAAVPLPSNDLPTAGEAINRALSTATPRDYNNEIFTRPRPPPPIPVPTPRSPSPPVLPTRWEEFKGGLWRPYRR